MGWLRDEKRPRLAWRRYGAAVVVVLLASLLSIALHPWLEPAPLAPFYAAVALSAWYGGVGPAVITIALSLAPITLVALEPVGVWRISAAEASGLVIFVLVSALLVLLSASRDRAEAAAERARARAEALAEATRALTEAGLDRDAVLAAIAHQAAVHIGDLAVVRLLSADGAWLNPLAVDHPSPAARAAAAAALATERHRADQGASGAALREDRPLRLDGVALAVRQEDDPDLWPSLTDAPTAVLLAVPLRTGGRGIGTLSVSRARADRPYATEDERFLQELADRAALAIDNARLYREARDAEAKISRLFDAGVIGLVVTDGERILEANDAFLQMVGSTPEDLAAGLLRWADLTPPEYADLDAGAIAEIAERGVCTPFEKEYVRTDGVRVPVLLGAAAVQGTAPPWICAVLDLTAQKAAEQDRVAFVDAATHDLKNPLTSLKARVQLLLRRIQRGQVLEPTALAAGLAAIDADATRMVTLIDELMDAAHLRTGQALTLTPVPTDLVALAHDCVADTRRRTTHTLVVESSEPALVGVWDRPRLERVVQNLLDNAIKYSPRGGDIVLRTTCEDDPDGKAWAVLSVQDNGVGIPAADLPHIFERFWRGSNVGGTVGAGIGLAGARQIVEQHGGTIAVASTEGKGSTVTVRLPLGTQ